MIVHQNDSNLNRLSACFKLHQHPNFEIMKLYFLLVLAVLLNASGPVAQSGTDVKVPSFNDKYAAFVKQLEAGQTDINYKAFRESFIESEQFIIASGKSMEYDSLENLMYEKMKIKDYQALIIVTKQMLSIDYTSMIAHKILRQTYSYLGDSLNAKKYKTIQFGLLNSIVKNGDGKTCATAWPVIQVKEEYFILQILGANLQKQTVDHTGGVCDKMEVKTEEGENKTYYFEISMVFEGYKKLGLK